MHQFTFIETKEQLQKACEIWNNESILAFDLECENNLHHYGVYLALIQVSTRDNNWIIDMLAFKEFQPLITIFESANIQKIFHDVSFDLRILSTQLDCKPVSILDTQLAALLLGKEKVGLGNLLESYFNVQKEKKFQRVDWTKRPMSEEMLMYAVKDTAYLLELTDKLILELKEKGRLEWWKQECHHLEELDWPLKEQDYIDLKGAKALQPRERAILKALFYKRAELAEQVDKPVFKVFRNVQLMKFATHPPYSVGAWKSLRGVHPLVKKHADQWHAVVQQARRGPLDIYERGKHSKLSMNQKEKITALTDARNSLAEKLGIKGHLIMNNDQIRSVIVDKNFNSLREWQKELVKKHHLL